MATFVLVHPAWFGGWCWKKVGRLLRAQGHTVYTPTLTGLGERAHLANPRVGLETHVVDVVNVLLFEDLDQVILTANSSAGAVVTAVANRVPERIQQVVYVDAFVPADGQCVLDLIPPDRRTLMELQAEQEGGGWLVPRIAPVPWEEFVRTAWQVTDEADLRWILPRLRPTPLGHFTEAIRLRDQEARQPRRVYIRCERWPNASFDRSAAAARSSPEWDYYRLDSSHLPYVTAPGELGDVLLERARLGPRDSIYGN